MFLLFCVYFENQILPVLLKFSLMKAFYSEPLAKREAITDDFYDQITPLFLIKQYKRAIEIKLYVMDFIAKHQH